jgi:hypothetical protein
MGSSLQVPMLSHWAVHMDLCSELQRYKLPLNIFIFTCQSPFHKFLCSAVTTEESDKPDQPSHYCTLISSPLAWHLHLQLIYRSLISWSQKLGVINTSLGVSVKCDYIYLCVTFLSVGSWHLQSMCEGLHSHIMKHVILY